MRKRFLSIFLVLALCLAYLPVQVHAATITTLEIEGGISYKARVNDQIYIYRDTILVTGNGSINLDIPYKALSIDGGTAVDLDTIAPAEQWEAGHTYEITLQIATTGTDEFDTGMTCTIDGKDVAVNVLSVDTAELTYQVYPATDATVDTPPAAKTGLVYNGDYQELTDPAVATGGTVLYSDSNAGPWSDEIRSEKNADTHDVWYMVQGDDSHFDTTPAGPVSVTIDLAPAPVLTATNPTIGYGSTINEGSLYTYTGLQGTDSITPTVTWATPLDTNTAEDYDYTVNAVYDGGVDGNYTGPIAAVTGTLTVSPLPTADYTQNPVPTVPTYNGQAQEIIAAATNQGEVQYSRDGGTTWSAAIPTETNAGDYDVAVKIVGTPGAYVDSAVFGLNAPIQPADGLTLAAKNTTITPGTAILDTHLYQLTAGELKGTDEIELTVDWVAGAAPDVSTPGTYEFNIAGYTLAAPGLSTNYQYLLTGETNGILTIRNSGGGSGDTNKKNSYDFTQPEEGPGSGKITDLLWKWGDRANLPKDLATLYMVLSNNSVSENEDNPLPYPGLGTEHFLASDATWVLPEVDPDYGPYDVQTVLVCEDHEPIYLANGDGKVDQSTFGNSDFYTVGVGTGDTKIDYANLKTGDVVSNTSFNGVFVTKLQKSNNPTFDADLAKLKSDTIASFRAFELDHPEVFWLNGSVKLRVLTVTMSGEQTSFIFMTLVDDKGFTMRIAEYAENGAIEKSIQTRDAAVAAIIAQVPANGTAREKVMNLNKWFTLNNEYNRSADLNSIGFTPHRSLKSLTGNFGINGPVCDGYSRGFKTVCDRLGIPVVLETGVASIGSHSELHMWMSIQIDGTWYGTDCTWNDPIVKGKDGKVSGYENEKYLLVGNDTVVDGAKFGVSHPANKTPGGTTGVLFATLILNPNEIYGYTAIDYDDIKSTDWFFDYVQDVSARGLMNGTSPNLFSPQGTATRGQIVQILYNIAGQPEVEDVKVEGWFGVPATWAMDKGIVAGYPDGDFHGNDPVTREQLATILWAFEGAPEQSGELSFADADKVSSYAVNAMLWVKKEGILGGKPGNLADPQGTATRAEIATIFSNYMK